jgi:hypothetical protein
MEGNGRRLGWIAIALGGLALFVALSGRAEQRRMQYSWQQSYGPPAYQSVPGPQGQVGPQGPFGPQGQFGPQQGRHEFEMRRPPFGGGPRRGFPGMFFLLPFMLIGGLLKLVFVVLLIWLGLRLIKGRGFGRPWGRGPWGHGPSEHGEQRPPDRPGPEQPPYTDDTQQM